MIHKLNGFSVSNEAVVDIKHMFGVNILDVIEHKDYTDRIWMYDDNEYTLSFNLTETGNSFCIKRKLIMNNKEIYEGAIAILEQALYVYTQNELINRQEGNVEQAELERYYINSISKAIAKLSI